MVDQRFELAFALLRPFAQLIDKIAPQRADNAAAFSFVRAGAQDLKRQPGQQHADDFSDVIIDERLVVIARWVADGQERPHKDDQLPPKRGIRRVLQLEHLHGHGIGNRKAQNTQKSSIWIIKPNFTTKQTTESSSTALSKVLTLLIGEGVEE